MSQPPWSGRTFLVDPKTTKVVAIFRNCLLTEALRCGKRMFPGLKLQAVNPGMITGSASKHLPSWTIRQWCDFTGVPVEEIVRPEEREYARAVRRAKREGKPRPPFPKATPVPPKVGSAGGAA